ncbi:MAG: hypothetical protein IK127_01915 [Clostridia bacterium]|nr:hypothetical protein [Clostridia bacterium]
MKRFVWIFLIALLICLCLAITAQADSLEITRVNRDPYGDVTVTWTGGDSPYMLVFCAVDGEDSTVWTVDDNIRSHSYVIDNLAPNFGFMIGVIDSNQNYDIYELDGNNKRFTDVSGIRLTFTLRQRVNGRSSTIQQYSAFELENSMTNGNLYGATIKLSGYKTTQPLPFTFRMAVTLPDGEPLVFFVERGNLPTGYNGGYVYWDFFDFSDLWSYILQAKDEIPVGNYIFYIYMDDGLVATAQFSVGR